MADSRIELIAIIWQYTLLWCSSAPGSITHFRLTAIRVMSPNFIGLASGSSASYLQLAILMRQFNFRISFGKNDKTPRAKLPLWAGRSKQGRQWVGKFLHARGYECGTRALYYHHWNSIELLTGGMIFDSSSTTNWMYSLSDPKRQHDWKWYTRARANKKETACFRFHWAPQTLWAPREIHYI